MDNLTKAQRRKNMQNIKSKDTLPEKRLMAALKTKKLYFARHVSALAGKPDIVFRRKKVAVFVDSDFWHQHKSCFVMPSSNMKYWKPKIARNVKRDKEVNKTLRKNGWKVLRFWECKVKKNADQCANRILKQLI